MNVVEGYFMYEFLQQEEKRIKIQNFIQLLTNSDNPNDCNLQREYLHQVGLRPSDLNNEDIVYIEAEATRKRNLF